MRSFLIPPNILSIVVNFGRHILHPISLSLDHYLALTAVRKIDYEREIDFDKKKLQRDIYEYVASEP